MLVLAVLRFVLQGQICLLLQVFLGFPGGSEVKAYAPTSNAEEADVEQLYEDPEDLLELTPKRDILFIIGDWNAKV